LYVFGLPFGAILEGTQKVQMMVYGQLYGGGLPPPNIHHVLKVMVTFWGFCRHGWPDNFVCLYISEATTHCWRTRGRKWSNPGV